MKHKYYLVFAALFTMTLAGCSKSGDDVTPTTSTTDLLTRKWAFSEINVNTDTKTYPIQKNTEGLISDDNTVTINKGGTYTYLDNGKTVTGQWNQPTDKTLVLTEAQGEKSTWTINALTSTSLELGSVNVNLTKGKDLTDSKVYTSEEQSAGVTALLLLSSLDKQNGGNVDFTKEAAPKSVQLVLKAKAM